MLRNVEAHPGLSRLPTHPVAKEALVVAHAGNMEAHQGAVGTYPESGHIA